LRNGERRIEQSRTLLIAVAAARNILRPEQKSGKASRRFTIGGEQTSRLTFCAMIEPEQIVYLDNNATTQLDPAVTEEMLPFLRKYYGNPSSGYGFAAQVRDAIDLARARVAALLGCTSGEIVFTSGGTEANNTAINSALQLDPNRQHIVTTAVEHSAVRRHCEQLAQRGYSVAVIGVNSDGEIDIDAVERAITPATAVISAMWANNETGVLFPIEEIAEIGRRERVLFHTDAVQAVGKLPIKVGATPINFLSLSAHKIYGPKGVGALFVNRRSAFRPMLLGGSQEDNRRAGTENVASIVGLGKAAELAAAAMNEEESRIKKMRDRFEQALRQSIPDLSINGAAAPRLPNTSSISFAGIESDAALMMLDRHTICCSAGSAMQLSDDRLRGSLRFSFGRFSTEADLERAVQIIPRVVNQLREMSAGHETMVATAARARI
jgi:cysteine desulfurase